MSETSLVKLSSDECHWTWRKFNVGSGNDLVPAGNHYLSQFNPYLYRHMVPPGHNVIVHSEFSWQEVNIALQWRHNERDGVSNHQSHVCLLNRLFRHISKKTSKLRVTGLCAGNSPVAGEFPAQKASNAEMFPLDGVIMNGSDQLHESQCWPNLPHDTSRRLSLLFVLATFPGLERILAWRVTFKSCKIFI